MVIEEEIRNTETILRDRVITENQLQDANNPNKMNYSYNIIFSNTNSIQSTENLVIEEEVMKLQAGKTTGQMQSVTRSVSDAITSAEMRHNGSDLGASTFKVSCNNGATQVTLAKDEETEITEGDQGTNMIIYVDLKSDSNNPNPRLNSLAVLYS